MKRWLFRHILFLLCALAAQSLRAQENVTTFGIQLKPIIPSKYFGTGTENQMDGDLKVNFTPNPGVNFGMILRKGFTKMWSAETGICMVQRNYTMTFSHPNLEKPKDLHFRYICYEIPFQGIVFIKLSDHLFMNASGGFSMDIYPSNVESSTYVFQDTSRFDFTQKTYRNGWLQFALLANYGFEWRSKKSGYFYFGVSYHRPFKSIGLTKVDFEQNTVPLRVQLLLGGNYLTTDFRYFFNEKPERKKPKG